MSQLHLYVDDSNFNTQYLPSTAWSDNTSDLWTGGNSKIVNSFPGAQLTFMFNGTSALFYGASLNDSKFAPVIDSLVQPMVSLPSSNPPTYGLWYQTPPLQPGLHEIIFNDLPKLTLDYIIVEIDPSTIIQNNLVLISDSDSVITYTGSWEQGVSRFKTLQPFTFIGDYSTRSSCNPGDTLTFTFAGTALQMWGVFDWELIGEVTAAYTIDDQQVAQQRYQADTSSQQRIDGVQTNFLLFSKNDLSGGNHRVLVNIISCTNQRFSLDYITYTPSFTSGQDAPPSNSSHTTPSTSSSQLPTGAIVGIVVGAVALAVVAVMALCLYRRRNRSTANPFPTRWSPVSFTRKESPSQIRQLRPQVSQEAVDLTEGTSGATTRMTAPRSSDTRSTTELTPEAPPPYRGLNPRAAPAFNVAEAANVHTHGGQT